MALKPSQIALEYVKDRIVAALRAELGESTSVDFGRARKHRWSVHLHGDVGAGGESFPFIAKTPMWESAPALDEAVKLGPQASTRDEFEELRRIESVIDGGDLVGITAVRPIVYDEPSNTIVMVELGGGRLDAALVSPTTRRSAAEGFLEAAGRWLAMYGAELGSMNPVAFDAEQYRRELESHLVVSSGRDDIAGLAAKVVELGDRIDGVSLLRGTTHGDFTPSNILVDDEGHVAVVDPNHVVGWAVTDLATLLIALRVHRWRALSFGRFPSNGRLLQWEAAARRGYGRIPDEVWEWAVADTLLRRWVFADDVRVRSTGLASWFRRLLDRRYVAEAGRLT